jgi:quinolinate synthase
VAEILKLKEQYPNAKVLVHPECKGDVLAVADVVGSTAVLLKYAIENPTEEYIVVTEAGILHEMQRKCKDTKFYPVPPAQTETGKVCACNECDYMKMNTILKLYNTLKYEWPSVDVDKDVATEAVKSIERMLELS